MNTPSYRAVHVVSSLSRLAGGVAPVVWSLASHQCSFGFHSSIATLRDRYTDENIQAYGNHVPVYAGRARWPKSFAYSSDLSRYMSSDCRNVDIVHVHGLWEYIGLAARRHAGRFGIPLIASLHGMLQAEALNIHPRRKMVAAWLFQDRVLRSAACLHATALSEFDSIRQYGLTNPVAIIPNGLNVAEYVSDVDRGRLNDRWPELYGKRLVLFLSRIHPIKGVVNLASAWGRLCQRYRVWHLVIAGPDCDNHEAEVRQVFAKAGASGHVTFCGPVYDQARKDLYAACDLFILPSFSENFGIVVAEALASGKPVITTKGTPWQELETRRCGWWIDIGVDPLEAAMKDAMELSDEQRRAMGVCGRQFIEEGYSWPTIAKKTIDVYRWILEGPRPDCVRLH